MDGEKMKVTKKDMENVATKQAENVVAKINNITYAKGVRR